MKCDLRVRLVGTTPPPIGGVSTHIWNLATGLRSAGIHCTVVDLQASPAKYPLPGVEHVMVDGPLPLRLARAVAALRSRKGEVVHFHMSSGARMLPLIAATRAAAAGRPIAITIHDGAIAEHYAALSRPARVLFRSTVSSANIVFALNSGIANFLELEVGVAPSRVVPSTSFVAPNGAQVARVPLTEPLAGIRRRASRLIVGSGFLKSYYRHDDLFRVAERLHASTGCTIVLASYGDYEAACRDSLRRFAASRDYLHMLEDVDYLEFLRLLQVADAYVRTSSVDSCGLAAWEAASLGTPTIATDVCARHPRTALYRPGDVDALTALLETMLADPESSRRGLKSEEAADALASVVPAYRRAVHNSGLRSFSDRR